MRVVQRLMPHLRYSFATTPLLLLYYYATGGAGLGAPRRAVGARRQRPRGGEASRQARGARAAHRGGAHGLPPRTLKAQEGGV